MAEQSQRQSEPGAQPPELAAQPPEPAAQPPELAAQPPEPAAQPPEPAPQRTRVYTDGACKGNPGRGGWAWVVPGERSDNGNEWKTTNNRMELTAAIKAIEALGGQLLVVTDSRYMSDCFEKRWWEQWEQNNWRTYNKTPVKNQDLWRPLIEAYKSGKVEFEWVKAHAGHPGNEEADWLANQAIEKLSAAGSSSG